MFPATMSNSLAFMMPVGTPPNALVFGTGRVRMADMVRYGLVLNLAGVGDRHARLLEAGARGV